MKNSTICTKTLNFGFSLILIDERLCSLYHSLKILHKSRSLRKMKIDGSIKNLVFDFKLDQNENNALRKIQLLRKAA